MPKSANEARAANQALINKLMIPGARRSGSGDSSSGGRTGFSDDYLDKAAKLFSGEPKSPASTPAASVRTNRADSPEPNDDDQVPSNVSVLEAATDRPVTLQLTQKKLETALSDLATAKATEKAAVGKLKSLEQKLSVAEQAKTKWLTYAGKMVQERKEALDALSEVRQELVTCQQQLTEQAPGPSAAPPPPPASGDGESSERVLQLEAQLEQHMQEKAEMLADQAKLKRTLEQLGDDFVAVEEKKDAAESSSTAAQATIDELREQLKQSGSQTKAEAEEPALSAKDQLRAKYSKTAATHGKMKDKLDAASARVTELETSLQEKTQELSCMKMELEAATAASGDGGAELAEAKIEALRESKSIVMRALEAQKNENGQLQEAHDTLQAQLDEWRNGDESDTMTLKLELKTVQEELILVLALYEATERE